MVIEQFNDQERVCKKLGIATSQKQKAIYLFLRQYEKNGGSLVMRTGKLTDQEVVADIILMTGTAADYHTYLNHYPAIAQRRFPESNDSLLEDTGVVGPGEGSKPREVIK